MGLILGALFFGGLLGYSTYHTFTKLPARIQAFCFKHELFFDGAVTILNILFITNISMSFMAVAAGVISEFTCLGLFGRRKRQLESKTIGI
jgi:hypothetical protein